MVTPGFVVSQPGNLRVFLEWFKERAVSGACVLVVFADFPDYLLDVATEKAQEGARFSEDHAGADMETLNLAGTRGISQMDVEAWAHAWHLVNDMIELDRGLPENIRRIVSVDDLLAPDDEQSLVHWFAAWSITKLDMYREFYVLGSSVDKQPKRTVRIPNYLPEVGNDPDDTGSIPEEAAARPQNLLHGRIFNNDRPPDISSWISALFDHLNGRSSFWVYPGPIAWLDEYMAQRCGDRAIRYSAFGSWLSTFKGFKVKVTTLVKLPYTPEGSPEESAASNPRMRHSWRASVVLSTSS